MFIAPTAVVAATESQDLHTTRTRAQSWRSKEIGIPDREGTKGTIEGPCYVSDAPEAEWNGTIDMRPDEPGTPFVFKGQVTATNGEPVPGAKLELWHADNLGFYSQFAPGLPEWNLRNTFVANEDGAYAIHTIRPDSHRGCLRSAHRSRRLARLASGAHALQGIRSRPQADHLAAVLPR